MKKPLHVLKFGGTSVGSVERIQAVARRIVEAKQSDVNLVVVVSAMSGETNRLVALANAIDPVPNARELDVLLSSGEQVSMSLLSIALAKLGHEAISLTGSQAKIVTDNLHNRASVKQIETDYIHSLLAQDKIVIIAGFQGITEEGDITTLGRGGSDTTAVAVAAALNAQECQIFTDVDGIYTCDPRIVKNAQKLASIDFPNMEEMARKGAKVLHLPSVMYAREKSVPIRVLSSFSHNEGTLVTGNECQHGISGLALKKSLLFVQLDHEELQSAEKQCQLLGISLWNVIEEAEKSGVIIDKSAYPKLSLVFADKIRNSEEVSSLTIVGSKAKGILSHSCESLSNHGIGWLFQDKGESFATIFLKPEMLENAANLIHEKQIKLKEELEGKQKLAIS